MEAGISTARNTRAEHRHDLRTLTYLTVNHVNAGVIRNLNQSGVGAQLVTPLQPGEQVRLQFELRNPKLRFEIIGEAVWVGSGGQCGLRFLELPPSMRQHLNSWIFGDLLESISMHAVQSASVSSSHLFSPPIIEEADSAESLRRAEERDGLIVSGHPAKVIQLPLRPAIVQSVLATAVLPTTHEAVSLDWLSQPLSPRAIARLVDFLAVVAAFLLFALIFLSVTRDAPPWPFTMAAAGVGVVAIIYWGFFWVFGGQSLGTRLARKAGLQVAKAHTDVKSE